MTIKTVLRLSALTFAIATPIAAGAVVPFDVRYESESAGKQTTTATFSVSGVETFDHAPIGNGQTLDTSFGTGGAITGRYTNLQVNGNDQYGGAGGTGKYSVSFGSDGYDLDLTSTVPGGVNYFGYWLSALDRGNQVSFYSKGKLLFTFAPQDVIDEVNRHADARNYYGNPNDPYKGANAGEPYIFLNFFNDKGSFDRIHFAELPASGGYESDNHTVGRFLTKGTGTSVPLNNSSVGAVPEPATWALMLGGFGMVGASMRRRSRGAVAA